MRNCRLPPTFIPATPSSQPLMTCPEPRSNENGLPEPTELSNFLPLVSQPVYCTRTVSPPSALGPVPALMSQYCRPEVVVVGGPLTLVGPPAACAGAAFFAVCPSTRATTAIAN